MAFPLFKDVGKSSTDIIKKGFPEFDRFTFRAEADAVTESGIQFTPFIQETGGKFEGELKAKFAFRDLSITTTGNLREDISVEASKNNIPQGVKWTLALNTNPSNFLDQLKAKIAAELRNDYTSTTLSLEGPVQSGKSGSKVLFSSVTGSREKGIAVGVDVELAPSTQEVKALNGVVLFSKRDAEITLFSKTRLGQDTATLVGTNFYQRFPYGGRDILLAAELSYELNKKNPSLALGSQFKPDNDTTVKVRATSKGIVGVAITEKWRGPLSVTLSSDFYLGAAGEGRPAFQYGVKLAFR